MIIKKYILVIVIFTLFSTVFNSLTAIAETFEQATESTVEKNENSINKTLEDSDSNREEKENGYNNESSVDIENSKGQPISSRALGETWISPKNESVVESALTTKSAKELGNGIRKKLKEVTNTKLGYLKGSTVEINLGLNFNQYFAETALAGTYKKFDISIGVPPAEAVMSIGYGWDARYVSFPIGSEGYSSDSSIKYKVLSNEKIIVERIKNKEVTLEEKLPMYVPLNSNGTFYYESAKESQYTGLQQFPIFVDLKHNQYNYPINGKNITLVYERLEENWQINKGDINILEHLLLESPPEVQVVPIKSNFDMPDTAPSTPKEYLFSSNTMSGGTLTYMWIDQLDVSAKSDQSVRVKVIDQLDAYKNEATTTLKFKVNPDKTSVVVKDSFLYQGQTYTPKDNFVSATDVNGNKVLWDDSKFKVSGDKIDTNKPGIYNQTLTYSYVWNSETKIKTANYKVIVKDDQSKLELQDVELYVGEKFDSDSPFKNVKDKDGNKLTSKDFSHYYIYPIGQAVGEQWKTKELDTSVAGEYKVRVYSWLLGKYSDEATITIKDKMTASPKNQILNLGQNFNELSTYDLVQDVKVGNRTLTTDEYIVSMQNTVPTDIVGDKTAKVLVTHKKDPKEVLSLDVPVKILWGNSVVYGGLGNDRTSATFTLFTGTNPYIMSSQGLGDDNKQIHSYYTNEQYYTFNWFDLSGKQTLLMNENDKGSKYIQANGNDLKKDKLKDWGINQKQAVNYGDIVRAWQTEPTKNWLYEGEERKNYTDGKKSVYFELTSSGYRPLHFNQLTPKVGNIPIYSTNQYLDEHVINYIDLKGNSNISVKGFSEYPDTTSSGEKKAKILVEETLNSSKKVEYEYEVTINVEQGTLNYEVPKTLTFREFTKSKSEQIVQRKYSGNLGLIIKDNRGSQNQGNWALTVKVSSKSESITPYLIYRDEKGIDSYLNGSAVPVYTQEKQVNATGPLEIEISGKWKSTDGILLKVPAKNNLSSKRYTSTITWNLVEGP